MTRFTLRTYTETRFQWDADSVDGGDSNAQFETDAGVHERPISPLEGEMAGKPEGGEIAARFYLKNEKLKQKNPAAKAAGFLLIKSELD